MTEAAPSRLQVAVSSVDEALASQRRWPVVLFVLALFLKLLYILESSDALFVQVPLMDSKYYHDTAMEIASGNMLRNEAFFMGPLYPYVLSVVYAIFGSDPLVVRLFQAIGGASTVVLTFLLGKVLFRPTVGFLAGLSLCFYGALTFYEGQLMMTWLGTLLNTAAIYVLVRPGDREGLSRYAVAGILIGASALARANILVFVPVALVWIFYLLRGPRRRAKSIAFAAAVIATLLPATIHNFVVSRDLVLVTSNAGINFYIGNSLLSKGVFYPPAGTDFVTDATGRRHLERSLGQDLTPSQVSRHWIRRAIREIASDPGHEAALVARKAAMFFNGYEVPQIESYAYARGGYKSLRLLFVDYWFLGALGLLGMLFSIGRWRERFLLYGFVVTYAISIVIFFVTSRYRVQIAPVMCLFAAHAVVTLAPRYVGEVRRAAAFAGAFVVLLLLSHPSLFALERDQVLYTEFLHQARRFEKVGDYERALDRVDAAIELYPEVAEGYGHRAIIHKSGGDEFKAIEDLSRAVDLEPGVPDAHYDLGQSFRRLNLSNQAIESYMRAIELDPYMVQAYNNLGITFRDIKRFGDAAAAFRKVIELDPRYTKAYNNLGACLGESGRPQEAIDVFAEAIRIDPGYANSYKNLAMAYIVLQRPSEALDAMNGYLALVPEDEQARDVAEQLRIVIESQGESFGDAEDG